MGVFDIVKKTASAVQRQFVGGAGFLMGGTAGAEEALEAYDGSQPQAQAAPVESAPAATASDELPPSTTGEITDLAIGFQESFTSERSATKATETVAVTETVAATAETAPDQAPTQAEPVAAPVESASAAPAADAPVESAPAAPAASTAAAPVASASASTAAATAPTAAAPVAPASAQSPADPLSTTGAPAAPVSPTEALAVATSDAEAPAATQAPAPAAPALAQSETGEITELVYDYTRSSSTAALVSAPEAPATTEAETALAAETVTAPVAQAHAGPAPASVASAAPAPSAAATVAKQPQQTQQTQQPQQDAIAKQKQTQEEAEEEERKKRSQSAFFNKVEEFAHSKIGTGALFCVGFLVGGPLVACVCAGAPIMYASSKNKDKKALIALGASAAAFVAFPPLGIIAAAAACGIYASKNITEPGFAIKTNSNSESAQNPTPPSPTQIQQPTQQQPSQQQPTQQQPTQQQTASSVQPDESVEGLRADLKAARDRVGKMPDEVLRSAREIAHNASRRQSTQSPPPSTPTSQVAARG